MLICTATGSTWLNESNLKKGNPIVLDFFIRIKHGLSLISYKKTYVAGTCVGVDGALHAVSNLCAPGLSASSFADEVNIGHLELVGDLAQNSSVGFSPASDQSLGAGSVFFAGYCNWLDLINNETMLKANWNWAPRAPVEKPWTLTSPNLLL